MTERSRGGRGAVDLLLLYGATSSSAVGRRLAEAAQALVDAGLAGRSVWVEREMTGNSQVRRHGSLARWRMALRNFVGTASPAVLWMCRLWTNHEKLLLSSYPVAEVRLYDDGLHSYVPQSVRNLRNMLGSLRPRSLARRVRAAFVPSRADLRPLLVEPADLARTRDVYHLFGDIWPDPYPQLRGRVQNVPAYALAEALELVEPRHAAGEVDLSPNKRPTALVLGQSFASIGYLPRDQEADVYRVVVGDLVAAGWRVAWKDHPRAEPPFINDMRAAAPEGAVFAANVPQTGLVETYLLRGGYDLLVAGSSTALATAKTLNLVQSGTFAERLVPLLSGRHDDHADLCRLVAAGFDDVAQVAATLRPLSV